MYIVNDELRRAQKWLKDGKMKQFCCHPFLTS